MYVQDLITATALRYGVDPALALSLAQRESQFQQSARGTSGEVGVFQLMPATAAGLQVDPYDLRQNVEGGIRYLAQQLARFGDTGLALAAYNAGPGTVSGGVIPSSTRRYVSDILGGQAAFAGESPPAILADGGAGTGVDILGSGDGSLGNVATAAILLGAVGLVLALS